MLNDYWVIKLLINVLCAVFPKKQLYYCDSHWMGSEHLGVVKMYYY